MEEKIPKKAKEKLEKMCKDYSVPMDLIDFHALYDRKLTESENLEILIDVVKGLSNTENIAEVEGTKKAIANDKEVSSNIEKEQLQKEEEYTKQEMDKAIRDITSDKKSNLNQYFEPLKNYVSVVAKDKGTLNSLFVCSAGGMGKTTIVMKTLAEEKVDYVYVNNYLTPLEFVNFLYEHKDKTIVLDDVETMWRNQLSINILKGALWGVGKKNKRIVSYHTTDKRLKAPKQFEFSGKIFFLLNKLPNDTDVSVKALMSRSLAYEMSFDYKETIEMLAEFVKIPYKKLEEGRRKVVFNYIKENTDDTTKDLNFRTIVKMYDLYITSKELWKDLSKPILKRDEKLALLKQFLNECSSVKQAQEMWVEETGRSRMSFFRYKKRLGLTK